MFSAIAPEPIASVASVSSYRITAPGAERTVLPQAAPAAPSSASVGNDRAPQNDNQSQQQQNPEPSPPSASASMFAAAVIGGTLSPRPQSVSEVYLRIGIAPISTESEAQLKDLTV